MAKKEHMTSNHFLEEQGSTSLDSREQEQEESAFETQLYAFFQQQRQEEFPLEALLENVRSTYPSPTPERSSFWKHWLSWGGLSLGLVSAVALVFIWTPSLKSNLVSSTFSTILDASSPASRHLVTRGGKSPILSVYLKRGQQKRIASSKEHFYKGDRLRLAIDWTRSGYVFVLHRDANGQLSPLYPASRQEQSIRCPKGKNQALPGSLSITGKSKGDEEIWACFSMRSKTFQSVVKSIQAASRNKQIDCHTLQRFVLRRTKEK